MPLNQEARIGNGWLTGGGFPRLVHVANLAIGTVVMRFYQWENGDMVNT